MSARSAAAVRTQQKSQRELEDLQLVIRARNGDDRARDLLVHRYTGFVRMKASSYFIAGGESAWDGFVQSAPSGSIFHLTAWKRLVETVLGHRPYYLVARQREEIFSKERFTTAKYQDWLGTGSQGINECYSLFRRHILLGQFQSNIQAATMDAFEIASRGGLPKDQPERLIGRRL